MLRRAALNELFTWQQRRRALDWRRTLRKRRAAKLVAHAVGGGRLVEQTQPVGRLLGYLFGSQHRIAGLPVFLRGHLLAQTIVGQGAIAAHFHIDTGAGRIGGQGG